MPHLLIAGTTGAGKSVGVNALIVSILYRARPDEVKFILIDPKRLELGLYEDIPHLATPIIVDPKLASRSLKWAVAEMERRYRDLAGWGVRNIDGYNTEIMRRNLVKEYDDKGEPWKPLPYIVIIIDELADLMMTSGREVEESITRLAQMARAVGIHLVLATQRPSVDVITGLIKANFPSRISFRVSSKVDSRTIIDTNGAEQLLGRGDMLFLPPGTSRLIRVHGAYIDETEIGRIVAHIKAQGPPRTTNDHAIRRRSAWAWKPRRRTRRAFRRSFAHLRRDEARIDFGAAASAAHRLWPRRRDSRHHGARRIDRAGRWLASTSCARSCLRDGCRLGRDGCVGRLATKRSTKWVLVRTFICFVPFRG